MKKFYRKKGSKYSIEELARLHERLANKYHLLNKEVVSKTGWDSPEYYIKNGYHNSVASRMRELNRRLTPEEKKDLYELSRYYFYN